MLNLTGYEAALLATCVAIKAANRVTTDAREEARIYEPTCYGPVPTETWSDYRVLTAD